MNTKDLKLEIEEIVKTGEKTGAEVCIDERNFIDKEHLDCFWYGGYLGSVTYRDYSIDIEVHGDVRATIFDKDGNEEYHYVNKNNDGAYSYSEVRNLIKNDAELYAFIKNGKICCEDNNWVEIFLRDAEGKDSGLVFDVLGDNVLDAFRLENVESYKEIIDNFIEENC